MKLFIPHHHNNFKARTLHNSSLLSLIGLYLIGHSVLSILTSTKPNILGYASQIKPEEIVSLTNQKRSVQNLPDLKINQQLNQAAAAKASDMFANNYWSHTSPKGVEPWFFVSQSGYQYLHAGENLARDFSTAPSIVDAWMNSPGHKKNLLDPRYTDIGVAVVDGYLNGVQTTLVVQLFGTPKTVTDSSSQLISTAYAASETQSSVSNSQSVISPFKLSQSLSLAFIVFIIFALAVDWFFVFRYRIIRLSGKTWAHLTYLIVMLAIILISKQGLISSWQG